MKVLRNCIIVDPCKGPSNILQDIVFDNNKIIDIRKSDSDNSYSNEINVEGRLVMPGLVDIHTHFRDPGQTNKEDIFSGSRAAAKGGFTTVVMMSNTLPPLDSIENIKKIESRVKNSQIKIFIAPTVTAKREGVEIVNLELILKNFESIVFGFSDDGDFVKNGNILKEALNILDCKRPVMEHSEDLQKEEIFGTLNYGKLSRKYDQIGRSYRAEIDAVKRDLELAKSTNGWIHIQHVSSKKTLDLIREAKLNNIKVTTEVTPHHLFFSESDLEKKLDSSYKVNPPLRTVEDAEFCQKALEEGLIDVIATDHAPHTKEEKEGKFQNCQSGISWLENAFGIVSEKLGYTLACDKMSFRPGRYFESLGINIGLIKKNYQSDFFVLDDKKWNLDPKSLYSKSSNYLFKYGNGNSVNLKGKPILTFSSGKEVYNSGEIKVENNE